MGEKITIMGAGHQGLAMAAHLSANGVECYLWNRSKENIIDIMNTKKIKCTGVLEAVISIKKVSTNVEDVLQKTILITTPSFAHKDIAKILAPYVDSTYTIILNPGRTFGILEFLYSLKMAGCKSFPCVAETQTIIYTCRRDYNNGVQLFALKEDVPISTLNLNDIPRVMSAIPSCIRCYFVPAKSYIETSLGNVGMILHCAPVLMNVGWIENSRVEFEYYYDGISGSIAKVLEKLDRERVKVSEEMGYPVESTVKWLKRTYHTSGNNLYEHLQSNIYYRGIDAPKNIHHRYIEEDIPNGLVPLESVGKMIGVDTPITTSIITFANIVMDCDFRKFGRQYSILKEIEVDYA